MTYVMIRYHRSCTAQAGGLDGRVAGQWGDAIVRLIERLAPGGNSFMLFSVFEHPSVVPRVERITFSAGWDRV